MNYDHKSIESKWQTFWEKNKTFQTNSNTNKNSRMSSMEGKEVLQPMGWDAFGLPAEQYAIDSGNSPAEFTKENIETFKRQLKELGFSYDWDREISTTDPEYYKWTQWIFL